MLLLFAIPLFLSLTLVALGLTWNRVLFALLSLTLLAANVSTLADIQPVAKATRSLSLLVNEVVGTVAVLVLVVLPWALGGLHPTREDLTWAILLSFGAGLLSVSALVLSVFDTGTDSRRRGPRGHSARRPPNGARAGCGTCSRSRARATARAES